MGFAVLLIGGILLLTIAYSFYRIQTGHFREDYMSLDEVVDTYFGEDESED